MGLSLRFGGWVEAFFYYFLCLREFFHVYFVLAYVDAEGGFLLCVYDAGLYEFCGWCVLSVKSGRSVEVSLVAPVGRLVGVLRGSLGEPFTSGASPVLINHKRRQ